ncbi:MAG: thioredoxin domain-containing protein [Bacillota bacterium]
MNNNQQNQLAREKSPYLQQHADNPVNWFPWSEEAFKKAREEDKPIFLSIGYSTCHWCHVMENESFNDKSLAELLNKHFISIKVDKEEKPEINSIYMEVCQTMTGSGGWPLTILITPDKKPFFAGTYFPKKNLINILKQTKNLWQNEKEKLLDQGNNVTDALQRAHSGKQFRSNFEINTEEKSNLIDQAASKLIGEVDNKFGGFGSKPKFPQPQKLLFLIQYNKLTGQQESLESAELTLNKMARGGIYDQIGYGFARYSTDRKWLVPHFEKMLYDNALLTLAYLDAYQATDNKEYMIIAEEILQYLEREMLSPEGGFYTAEDADVDGKEGEFYLWKKAEIIDILGQKKGVKFCQDYGITKTGNFEGKNIPNLINTEENLQDIRLKWKAELRQLHEIRKERKRPFKDDKILTGWNGLAIAAFARAGKVLGENKYYLIAEEAFNFIDAKLKKEDGTLLGRYRDGQSDHPAQAEAYSFLIFGLIELYQAGYNPKFIKEALNLNEIMLNRFWDEEAGGLFVTRKDQNELPFNKKEIYDGAIPSTNSIAAFNWYRLFSLTYDNKYRKLVEKQLKYFYSQIKNQPQEFSAFMSALMLEISGLREIIIITDQENYISELITELANSYLPFTSQLVITPDSRGEIKQINQIAAERKNKNNWTIYICQDQTCQQPITTLAQFKKML